MQIDHLDHLVLTVQHVQTTCIFYHLILGMQIITFAGDRKALQFGNQKINLHQKGKEIDPKAQHPTVGSADLCFITLTPIDQVITHLQKYNIPLIIGPVKQDGAIGPMLSIYFRDPDGNLLEVSNYV